MELGEALPQAGECVQGLRRGLGGQPGEDEAGGQGGGVLITGDDLDESEETAGLEELGEQGEGVQAVGDGGQAHAPGEDFGEARGGVVGHGQPLSVLNVYFPFS